jgi:D-aspartate ligase
VKKGVIITDKHAISYGLIRYCAQYEIPIILIYFDDLSICRFSKFVTKSIKLKYSTNKSIIDQLISLSKKYDFSNYLLIPCDDKILEYFSRYKKELSNYYIPICSDWKSTRIFIDKLSTYQLCEKLGIRYPKLYQGFDDTVEILDNIKYPVILYINGSRIH